MIFKLLYLFSARVDAIILNNLEQELLALENEYNLPGTDKSDPFPRLVTAMMMGYIITENIESLDPNAETLTNIFDRLCAVFVLSTPRSYECKNESIFWKTIDSIYLYKGSVKYQEIWAVFESAIKHQEEPNLLRICYQFTSAFALKISESTKYKICKCISDKFNGIFIIHINIEKGIVKSKSRCIRKIEMYVRYVNCRIDNISLYPPYTKEIEIRNLHEMDIGLANSIAPNEYVSIASDLNIVFVKNVTAMIRNCINLRVLVDNQSIVSSIYYAAKHYISFKFSGLKKNRNHMLSSKMVYRLLKRPIKYHEIKYDNEMILLAKTLEIFQKKITQ